MCQQTKRAGISPPHLSTPVPTVTLSGLSRRPAKLGVGSRCRLAVEGKPNDAGNGWGSGCRVSRSPWKTSAGFGAANAAHFINVLNVIDAWKLSREDAILSGPIPSAITVSCSPACWPTRVLLDADRPRQQLDRRTACSVAAWRHPSVDKGRAYTAKPVLEPSALSRPADTSAERRTSCHCSSRGRADRYPTRISSGEDVPAIQSKITANIEGHADVRSEELQFQVPKTMTGAYGVFLEGKILANFKTSAAAIRFAKLQRKALECLTHSTGVDADALGEAIAWYVAGYTSPERRFQPYD